MYPFTPLHGHRSTLLQTKLHADVIAEDPYSLHQGINLFLILRKQLEVVHEEQMVNPASILRHFVSRTNLPQNHRQRDQRQNKQQWRQRITLELQSQHKDSKPWWKRRLEGQINELRKDLIRIEQMDRGAMKDSDMRNRFMKKYQVKGKGMSVVKEEIKQRVKAKAAKAKRYDDRVRQFQSKSAIQYKSTSIIQRTGREMRQLTSGSRASGGKDLLGGLWDQPAVNIADKPNG